MLVGIPAEVKNRETRVALTPSGASELVALGHDVVIQAGAGVGSMIPDQDYVDAGARIGSVDEAWGAELVLKVKEPVPEEYGRLGTQTLFTFLHLAANRPLADALTSAGTTALSLDTVQLADGSLPLLAPMSAVAGRLAALAGGYHLLSSEGGPGILMGGIPGVPRAATVVIGAGVAGTNAVQLLSAMGAGVTVLDLSEERLRRIDAENLPGVTTVVSTPEAVDAAVTEADLVVGAVLVPGHTAPKLVSHEQVSRMRQGSVLVDIAIDQGGCFEDSRPTTHDDPVYVVEHSVFYCVANMPGAVGATSTAALTHVTLPYIKALVGGVDSAIAADAALAAGLNVAGGRVVHPVVARAFPDLA
ncbi:alanine dehydrogenase [Demequina oxidasica]|uniref:alanine dehydrogenase n=1 Tax=Demequina oxidasica TaxID=676199 RepID=UPI000781F329|nr:alanine dehydrogenase [Demequina oxidasica]